MVGVAQKSVQNFPVAFEGLRSIIAVSYTHLRAHETVLDLVCRLLLAKKKKNKPNRYYPAAH